MAGPRECKFIEQLLFTTAALQLVALLRLVAQFLDDSGFLPGHEQPLPVLCDDVRGLRHDVLLGRHALGQHLVIALAILQLSGRQGRTLRALELLFLGLCLSLERFELRYFLLVQKLCLPKRVFTLLFPPTSEIEHPLQPKTKHSGLLTR
jgi:hypothetical protein